MNRQRVTAIGRLAVCIVAAPLSVVVLAGPLAAEPAKQAPPTLSLEPSSGLNDGDTVTVTGTGFSPSSDIGISMCAAVVSSGDDCDYSGALIATTDAQGGFAESLHVVGSITTPAGGKIECEPDKCGIGAANLAVQTEVAAASLTFGEESTSTTDAADTGDDESADAGDAARTEDDGDLSPVVPATLAVLLVAGAFLLYRRIRGS